MTRVNYARLDHQYRKHHERYVRYVEKCGLLCQECGGSGGGVGPINEDGSGPFEECGFCEGTGLVTRWMRGLWLRWKREDKMRS